MLYKKYHRSYINQFKKGIRFTEGHNKIAMWEVDVEPFIRPTPSNCTIRMNIKMIKNGISIGCSKVWIAIFSNGRLGFKFYRRCCIRSITETL